ncbi:MULTISPECIES: hypothetical protein [unclassified Microcoleus]|uniref:hypothetical protein n=1 Tax=unclassified Microcoleus TaxID=2642155 RepID=UPI001D7935FF|nr:MULTISPECIES: hypothetical protein [unclassified Microcoleus]MCC3464542.1 hypothetical protein [Microcoleus sp. PH2017_06_SFM_O_A]MCC3410553.1 hypothetical protein [Microcoleus sp. PH2017_02_FOX_O_A]MCC3455776.1 hypothetical protein [Microcoleus sp. PH2017_08_TRC_O_A]MCC3584299.1 hypothetical protein [Microcoleus sp. PH2017_30_WIL_O_A]MCC3590550.1 hypothetical protein [Microcoleus sp. PH2017_28_MFU_U_A]
MFASSAIAYFLGVCMITEDTRIDYERVGDITSPPVFKVLSDVYGSDFGDATQEERLVLVEAIAYSLRVGGAFRDNLRNVVNGDLDMPCGIFTSAGVGRNEGLKLLAILQVAIVECY